ncbi:hypothetical protein SAMN04487911_1211 [Arenibacter nanhaiticus]|uniref:Uncharacterized protein n=1 Tax=Arenibacter nanhaiticus TaxID=558155 RepID=A0A1M6J8N2_9FLAO|nr:hypothetical protein [Arenibacter nanhaiticus]SHJ43055.1 hypothetical protein SAMN04487911_1211 [Arenibacter nanhaiticus]
MNKKRTRAENQRYSVPLAGGASRSVGLSCEMIHSEYFFVST